MECIHEWKLDKEEVVCTVMESRGSGQYNDPCYGANCPCEQGWMVRRFVCSLCGAEKSEEE